MWEKAIIREEAAINEKRLLRKKLALMPRCPGEEKTHRSDPPLVEFRETHYQRFGWARGAGCEDYRGFTAVAGLAHAESEEPCNQQNVAMSDMPASVQKTIQDNFDGGTIIQTAKETEEGNTVYEAYVKKSGGRK
jgi:hypothetical protein